MKSQLVNRFLTALFASLVMLSCSSEDEEEKLPPFFHEFTGTAASGSTIDIRILISDRAARINESFYVYNTQPGLTASSPNKTLISGISHFGLIEGLIPGKTYYIKGFIDTEAFGMIESDEITVTTKAPAATTFPQTAYRGDKVNISGENFSTNISDYVVKFGDYTATVSSAAAFSITVVVPQNLPRGSFKISLAIGATTITSTTDFLVLNAPTVTSMTPIVGSPGTTVQVKGKDFTFSSGSGLVKFGSVTVIASNISNIDPDNASFTFTVPSVAPGQYDLVVGPFEHTSTAPEKFTIPVSPWVQKTSLAGAVREGAVSFTIGDKAYVAQGINGTTLIDLWEYDMTADTWTRKTDFPGDAREGAVAFSIGNKGYVGCGHKETFTTLKDFWEYNPATNSWTKLADFGGTARSGAVGVSVSGKGYIGLGRDASALKKDWWEYNPASNTWTQRADFTGEARENGTAVTIGSKAYVGLGNKNSLAVLADFYEYDPTGNAWTKKPDFGGGGRSTAAAFTLNGQALVGSGFNASINPTKDFWKYDPSSNQWTKIVDLDVARFAAVGFASSSAGFILSGHNTTGAQLGDVWKYNP